MTLMFLCYLSLINVTEMHEASIKREYVTLKEQLTVCEFSFLIMHGICVLLHFASGLTSWRAERGQLCQDGNCVCHQAGTFFG